MRAEVAAALARMEAQGEPPAPAPGPPVPTPRRGALYTEQPAYPDAPRGVCRWCGEPIRLVDGADYRRARRRYHYGDKHEIGGVDCVKSWRNSTVWDAREAVLRRDLLEKGRAACADCGLVCVERIDEAEEAHLIRVGGGPARRELERWEADHEVPLEDGGPHTLANLRCRCVPCHRAKTKAENRARAAKRRVDKAQTAA